jgi:hypothetical protein
MELAPRLGFRVSINESHTISIEQKSGLFSDRMLVVVHPDDVTALVSMLGVMCQKIREGREK